MPEQTHLSRRQTPVSPPASQDGTWGMLMSLLQRVNRTTRLLTQAVTRPRRLVAGWIPAILLATIGLEAPAEAQQPLPQDIDYTIPANPYSIPDYSGSLNAQPTTDGVGGFGIIGRAGHEAGNTVGRDGSLTYFDMSPFSFVGDSMIFGDGRLFVMNNGKMGGSAGLGFRHFFPNHNAVLGSTFYYDHDESRGVTFEQFTIANEVLTEFFDIRANVHLPFGNKNQVTGVRFESGTQQFVDAVDPVGGGIQGSNISFQTRTFAASALEGVDLGISAPLLGEFAERYNLEATAGGYHYQARGQGLQKVSGFKLRMDGDFFDRLSHMFLEVTSDNVFDTNVVFGADINYWNHLKPQPRLRKSQYSRMASWVRRSRTISTFDTSFLNAPQLAVNPNDGDPYLIYHVRNNPTPPPANFPAPLGNGSLSMPFQYIQEGIDASPLADIVFVHANSVFDGVTDGNANATAVLREDVLVLGEGVPLTIPVAGITGEIDLPTVTPGALTRPIIQNATGPIVTMANNSRFAGFTIQNYADGPAILADGIANAIVNEVIIDGSTGAAGSGIEVNNSSGAIVFENVSILNTSGDAFSVSGGNAAIVFNGENQIVNSSGFATIISNAGGSVNMRNTTITDDGGEGVIVGAFGAGTSTSNVTFDEISLSNTFHPTGTGAFQVMGHAGSVTVLNDLTIDTPDAGGILVIDHEPSGSVVFQGPVSIFNRNEFGIVLQDAVEGPDPTNPTQSRAGSVNFQDSVTISGLGPNANATQSAAVSMQSSSGTLSFADLTIDESLSQGILIANLADTGGSTGRFVVNGQTTITNALGTSILLQDIQKEQFQTIFTNVSIDDRAAGIGIFDTASITRFLGITNIDNSLASTATAINIQDNTGDVSFNSVNVNAALGAVATDAAVIAANNNNPDVNDIANVSFTTLDVEFTGAAGVAGESAVDFFNNEDIEVAGGVLDATNARAITVSMNTVHNLMFESISASRDDFGILVTESPGSFIVTGRSAIAGSGGTISLMTAAGASFDNTQVVDLEFMDYEGNEMGVVGDTILFQGAGLDPLFVLRGLNINDSNDEAIQLVNVSDFMLLQSSLDTNGITGENQIDFLATINEADINGDGDNEDPVIYNVDIINNSISDGPAVIAGFDMISIRTGAGISDGAQLNLNVLNNGVPGTLAPLTNIASNRGATMAALGVVWTGPSNINIDSNTFILTNGPGGGVGMILDGVSNVAFTNNDLSSTAAGTFGIDFQFDEATNLVISDNSVVDENGAAVPGSGFQMSGINSTAMLLTFLAGGNDIEIENNLINQSGVDSTGIDFERIFAPSSVTINNNLILQVTDFDTVLEEGIIFRDVRGVINLNGSQDNSIPLGTFLPFYVDFFIPNGTSNGQIIVNGSPRP